MVVFYQGLHCVGMTCHFTLECVFPAKQKADDVLSWITVLNEVLETDDNL